MGLLEILDHRLCGAAQDEFLSPGPGQAVCYQATISMPARPSCIGSPAGFAPVELGKLASMGLASVKASLRIHILLKKSRRFLSRRFSKLWPSATEKKMYSLRWLLDWLWAERDCRIVPKQRSSL